MRLTAEVWILYKFGFRAKSKLLDFMRHTAAMELLIAGVDLIYIRDLLGHSSVITTEVYARTDAKLKRKAIEAASKEILPPEDARWDNDTALKDWLKNFNRR